MIEDIKEGNISVVLIKDLSRLGRNYVMTGQYTDFFFPEHGVRYVAINDSYDSAKDDRLQGSQTALPRVRGRRQWAKYHRQAQR